MPQLKHILETTIPRRNCFSKPLHKNFVVFIANSSHQGFTASSQLESHPPHPRQNVINSDLRWYSSGRCLHPKPKSPKSQAKFNFKQSPDPALRCIIQLPVRANGAKCEEISTLQPKPSHFIRSIGRAGRGRSKGFRHSSAAVRAVDLLETHLSPAHPSDECVAVKCKQKYRKV